MYKGIKRKVSGTCLSMTCKALEKSFSVTPWVYFVKLQQGMLCCWHFLLLLYSFLNSNAFLFLMLWSHSKTLEHSQIVGLLTLHNFLSCNHESCVYCGLPATWLQPQVMGAKTKGEKENCSNSLLVLWFSKDNIITNTESLCVYMY